MLDTIGWAQSGCCGALYPLHIMHFLFETPGCRCGRQGRMARRGGLGEQEKEAPHRLDWRAVDSFDDMNTVQHRHSAACSGGEWRSAVFFS